MEMPVPFDASTINVAMCQLTGPSSAKLTAFMAGRETLIWASEEEVRSRQRKALRVLDYLDRAHPTVNLIVFPEYTLPVETMLPELQEFSDVHRAVIIAGSDGVADKRGRIYNRCPVVIPKRRHPVWISKRELSQWELTKVESARNRQQPLFTWSDQVQQYWFSVHICQDFFRNALSPTALDSSPGLFIVPMCSPDITTFQVFGDALLRNAAGRAVMLCNAYDSFAVGNSSVMALIVDGKAFRPAVAAPKDGEYVLVFDVDCASLAPQSQSFGVGRSLSAAHLLRIAQDFDVRPAERDAAHSWASAALRGGQNVPNAMPTVSSESGPSESSGVASSTAAGGRLRVFLCHTSADKPYVRQLYRRLVLDGFAVWLDEEDIFPGQDWNVEVLRAVKNSHIVIVCLSQAAIGKTGYVQKEIRFALDAAAEQPDGATFLIPAKLEECEVPNQLARWQWVSLLLRKVTPSLSAPFVDARESLRWQYTIRNHARMRESLPNFTLKLVRPGLGPPAEPAPASPALRRHGGCSSPRVACNFSPATAAPLSLRHAGPGRTA